MKTRFATWLIALASLLSPGFVSATTYTWYGNYITGNPDYPFFDNNYNNRYNWYPEGVPGAGDTAMIPTNSVPVYLYSSIAVSNLNLAANCIGSAVLNVQTYGINLYGQLNVGACNSLAFGAGGITGMTTNATLTGGFTSTGGTLGGTLTLDTNSTFTMYSGTIAGTFNLRAGSVFDLAGGGMAGTLNVGANGTFLFASGTDQNIPGATINNYGTVTWSSGRIRGGGIPGTTVNNYGLWDSHGDLTFNADYAGDGFVFNNSGTFRKSAGTATTSFGPLPFYNYGTVDVETGTISLSAGGVLAGGAQTGSGILLLAAGGFNLNGMTTTTNLQLAGGTLYGQSVINGGLNWVVGSWSGVSTLLLTSNSILQVTSASDHDFPGVTFTNFGTVAWSGPGRIRGGGIPGTTVYNYGLWDSQGDWVLNDDFVGDGTVFYNYATLRKSAGVANTSLSGAVYLYNAAALEIDSGTLNLTGGGYFAGGAQTGPGTLLMSGGGYTLAGMTTTTNALLSGAILYGDNVINGGLNWVVGDWVNANSVTIATNSILYITSGNDHNLAFISVTNYGTVAWQGGRVRGGGVPGTYIDNYGLWDSQGDLTLNDDYVGDGTLFNNYGVFRKSVGINTTSITGVTFQNTGLLDIQTGSIAASGAFYNTGPVNVASGSLVLSGGGIFTSGVQTGSGLLQLTAGAYTFNGLFSTNLLMAGGTLYGNNEFKGALTWSGGDWSGASSVTIDTNTVCNINSGSDHNLAGCTLNNSGTIYWSGGRIRGGGIPGTVFNNYGLMDSQGDLTFNNDYAGAGTIFNNFGTFRKSVGAANTTFTSGVSVVNKGTFDIEAASLSLGGAFANTGLINIVSGTVYLGGGGVLTGGAQSGQGMLQFGAGYFTDNGMTTTTNLEMIGGILYGNNLFTSGLTWYAGNWDSASSVTIPTNTSLCVISVNDHDLASCTLNNYGTVTWTGGRLRGGGNPGTVYNNYGLWDSQADLIFNSDLAVNGYVFNNYGTFLKSGGTASTTFAASTYGTSFKSSGMVNIATAALTLGGGGIFTGGSITGSGLEYLTAGSFSFLNTAMGTNVQQVGGNLVGRNVINGLFAWNSGNWDSATSVTILTNSAVNVVSASDHDLATCTLTNFGTLNWTLGRIRGGGNPGTLIYNYGLWDAQSDYALNSDYAVNGVVFDNFGNFRKSAGSTGTYVSASSGGCVFNNAGSILNLSPTPIYMNGGGVFSAGSVSGLLQLYGGYYNINGTVTSTNVQETAAYLYGSNVLSGGFGWVGGNWNSASSVTVLPNTELDIASAADHALANCILNNNGRVEWLGGRIVGGGNPGTVINNNNLWEVQCDYSLASDYGLNGVVFNNAGLFRKLFTTGTTTFNPNVGVATFNSNPGGPIELDSGTLSLPGSFTLPSGGLTIGLGGTNAGQYGHLVVAANAYLAGALNVIFTNSFQPAQPEQFPVVTSVYNLGGFSQIYLPYGLTVTNTTASVILQATASPTINLSVSRVSGTNLDVSIPTSYSQSYTVQLATNLPAAKWVYYTNFTGSGLVVPLVIPITTNTPQLYLRVRQP